MARLRCKRFEREARLLSKNAERNRLGLDEVVSGHLKQDEARDDDGQPPFAAGRL